MSCAETEQEKREEELIKNEKRKEHNEKQKEHTEKQKEHTDLPKIKSVGTPILIAAKNGITELVEKILHSYPVAMYDRDQDKKNIVLLAVEHKQPRVYELLLSLKKNIIKDSIFCEVDSEGNNALHLAAKKANFTWPVPGAASQMQWEIKWFQVRAQKQPI